MRNARLISAVSAVVAAAVLATGISLGARAPDGKALIRKNCGGCHTLKAAGVYGKFGPNLDRKKPTKARVIKFVRKGGNGMPAFTNLSNAQVNAIATYVFTKTRPKKK